MSQENGTPPTDKQLLTDPGVGHVIPASEVPSFVRPATDEEQRAALHTWEATHDPRVAPACVVPNYDPGLDEHVNGPRVHATVVHAGAPLPEPGSGYPVGVASHTAPAPVQLQSQSNEHFTPSDIVERARWLMGSVDLDPASCVAANATVKATYYITRESSFSVGAAPGTPVTGDGLQLRPWRGNVFLNPPGGSFKVLNKKFSNAALWWAALVQDWLAGEVKQAIFIGFTLEILRHSQNGCPLPCQAFPRCYPKKRIKFVSAAKKKQPTHGNVIVWLPPIERAPREAGTGISYARPVDESPMGKRFLDAFGGLGLCEF